MRFLLLVLIAVLPGAAVAADTSHITDERFDTVRKIFEAQGTRVERDPKLRDTVRIYIPMKIAIDLSKAQAQGLASMARSRLGEKAIVYVKNEIGDTIAKAAPWGLE